MKTKIAYLLMVMATSMTLMVACKKEDISGDFDTPDELQTQSDDQARVSAELDAVANDANMIMNDPVFDYEYGFNSRTVASSNLTDIICDATVSVDTVSNPRTITVTYNGTNCASSRIRTGTVVFSMAKGVHWGDQGAELTANFQNVSIKRLIDNKTIKLNGTKKIKNVSGGRLYELANVGNITHQVTSSNMKITFDNGSERNWQLAVQRVFTYDNGVVISTTGTHSDGATQGIAEWGTNRFGKSFSCAFTEPLVVRQDCNFRLTSGVVKYTRGNVTTTTTFGLNSDGNPTTCPGAGKFYLKISWTGPNGTVYSFILPY